MRPSLNGNHDINATTINIKNLPVSRKVLYMGDKFRINDVSTEYTIITSDITSNSSGEASILIASPGIIAAYVSTTPVQVPNTRYLTDEKRTAISSETGNLIYFIKFQFDDIYRISDISSSPGSKSKITSSSHGLLNGATITIDTPFYYEGVYTIEYVDTNNFIVDKMYDSTESKTGSFDVDSSIYLTTAPTDILWDSRTWIGIGGLLIFDAVTETSDLKGNNTNFKLSGVDPTVLTLILSKASIGRDITMWSGHINSDGTILCDNSRDIIMRNQMVRGFEIEHVISRDDSAETVTISGSAEDSSVVIDRVVGIQTNPKSYNRFYPNDKFFDEIPSLIGKQIKFGKLDVQGGKGGCFFWLAVTLTLSSQVLMDDTLNTLRSYRDYNMDKSVKTQYKEIAPKIISGISKYTCKSSVYKWISNYTLDLAQLVKEKKYVEAENLYYKNLKILEKFIG